MNQNFHFKNEENTYSGYTMFDIITNYWWANQLISKSASSYTYLECKHK